MSFRNYSFDSSSYGRSRDATRAATSSTERPTSVTAKYLNTTPSFKTSSIPIPSAERTAREETPISTIASRYASYSTKTEKEKPPTPTPTTSKYERKDYKITAPPATTTRSRDVSPVSTAKYSLTRPSRHLSPERKTKSYKDLKSRDPSPTDRDKDIPSKTDKSSGYNSLSSFKLYPRPTPTYSRPSSRAETKPESTYTRPSSRAETKPESTYARPSSRAEIKPEATYTRPSSRTEIKSETSYTRPSSRAETKLDTTYTRPSSRTETKTESSYTRPLSRNDTKLDASTTTYTRPSSRTETKPEVTVNRYGIANRLSSNYLRSPPTVKRQSVSPVSHIEIPKTEPDKKPVSPCTVIKEESPKKEDIKGDTKEIVENGVNKEEEEEEECEMETVTVITRHTSPTPPGSSVYVRTRRADMAKTIEKTRTRKRKRPEMIDREIQSDRLDDPTRCSRFGSTARASTLTNWSLYTPSATSYTGYAGRYSTQHSTVRDNSSNNSYNDRSSRSLSTESHPRDTESVSPSIENKLISPTNVIESNQDITLYGPNKDNETSEIIINVNLKLTRAKSPLAVASAELVSPEITITNSQLPPQVPKNESATKVKKVKVRKTSSDSSTDSSAKKKVVKRKSKSGSSSDSDHTTESSDKPKETKSTSPPKNIQKTSSSSNLTNGHMKLKHSKSRESNSPESSITFSTQSSLSEEDMTSKSKNNEVSRTSAGEISIPTDRSAKQQSSVPQKSDGATEDAKSFLIRALAPVTSLFKRHQENSDSRWLETSTSESTGKDVSNLTTESEKSKIKSNTDNIVASNDNNQVKLKAIRHIESGERAWWMDTDSEKKGTSTSDNLKSPSEKNIPKKIRHIESGERAWWLESNGDSKSDKLPPANGSDNNEQFKIPKKNKYAEDEKPWWLDSCANIPEGIERLTPPRKSSSDSDKSEKFNFFKVRHIESGDQKDWWATSNENSNSSKPEYQNSLSKSGSNHNNLSKSGSNQNNLSKSGSSHNNLSKSSSNQLSFPLRRIRHIESGERPWWLASDKNIPEGIEKLPTPPPQEDSDSSDSDEVQVYIPAAQIPPFPLHLDDEPLGDRRSPEGLETPKETEPDDGRVSPYENHRQFRRRGSGNSSYQKSADKFVSRYTDIDDILGTSGHVYRPFMDSILARRTGQMPYDDEECEEIDPTQVRIHDSTAQRPVIKKLRSRSEIIDCRDEDQVNDAWTSIADEMLVPVGELKKKKDTLLAAFRLNHKKVVASKKSGAGESDVHKPIWIFYDALAAFMSDVYGCKAIITTEDSADTADVQEDADGIPDTQKSPRPQETKNPSQLTIPVQKRRSNNPPELAETSAQMKTALSSLNAALTGKKTRAENVVDDDDCDLYGKLLAKVLRDFSEIDRLELRHEIDGLIIKKKRSALSSRHYVASPSQIILSTNNRSRPSTSSSMYTEQMTDEYPSSPYVQENRRIHRPSSSRSMYSSLSPSPRRIQNQQNISRHVYAVASPPDLQTMESEQNMSQHGYGVASPPDLQTMESQQNMSQHVYGVASPPDCQTMASLQNMSPHVYGVASPPYQEDQSSDILLKACKNAKI